MSELFELFELNEEQIIDTLEFVNKVLDTDKKPGDMLTVDEMANVMSYVIQSEVMEVMTRSAIRDLVRPTQIFEINIPSGLFDGLFDEEPDEEEL